MGPVYKTYFQGEFVNPPTTMSLSIDYLHLIVMVHGLEGNSNDLRLWKTGLEQLYPLSNYEFLLCTSNHNLTHESILDQGARITQEVQSFLSQKDKLPNKISFIGHRLVHKVFIPTQKLILVWALCLLE